MGAPRGNLNAIKDKPWSDAIRRACLADDGRRLRVIAEKLLEKAIEGDIQAMKEIGDRMDGKSEQRTTLAGDVDAPLFLDRAADLLEKIRG